MLLKCMFRFCFTLTSIGACADTPVHTQRSAIRTASAKGFRHCGSLSEATKNSRRQDRLPNVAVIVLVVALPATAGVIGIGVCRLVFFARFR